MKWDHFIGMGFIGMAVAATQLAAGESVLLATGYRLHADWHELDGDRVRLFASGGVTEIPVSLVADFEADQPSPVPVAQPAPTPPLAPQLPPTDIAGEAARKVALPEAFVRSVMQAESNFQPTVVSPKGAIGLMQLMPETAKALGVDPRDPRQNAEGGARYLRELLERYQNDPDQVLLALAAYNAGPGAVEKYHGVPPYNETRQYILRVLKAWSVEPGLAEREQPAASR